jgi:uncharacterized protein YndB with AHSA1/START domain
MNDQFVAKSAITINAPVSTVWKALTTPEMIKQYMFGSEVVTDWQMGSPIIWKGIWEGKPYEDHGQILKFTPEKLLQVTHFSPLTGAADIPENYHTLTYELSEENNQTNLTLSQDNNANEGEQKHSQQMWDSMLGSIKQLLEK